MSNRDSGPSNRKLKIPCRWAVRNCGLMLIKALITRLAGGNTSYSSYGSFSTITYEKYPVLAGLVVRLLQRGSESDEIQAHEDNLGNSVSRAVQTVFPALELVTRFGVPEKFRALVRRLIARHIDSRNWALREKAAHTLSFITTEKDIIKLIQDQLRVPCISQNGLHGRLLCLRFIVRRKGYDVSRMFSQKPC